MLTVVVALLTALLAVLLLAHDLLVLHAPILKPGLHLRASLCAFGEIVVLSTCVSDRLSKLANSILSGVDR